MDFNLMSEDLCTFNKDTEDLMYEIQGNISLIKQIVAKKIAKEFGDFLFDLEKIKQLKVYVTKDVENIFTELWFDFDTNNDLCFITKRKDLALNDVLKIEYIVAKWLLSE